MTSIKNRLTPAPSDLESRTEDAVKRTANVALRLGSEVGRVDSDAVSPVISGLVMDSLNLYAREVLLPNRSSDLTRLYDEAVANVVKAFGLLGDGPESKLGSAALRAQSELKAYGAICESQQGILDRFSRLGPQAVPRAVGELPRDLSALAESALAHAAPHLHDQRFASLVEETSDTVNRDLRKVGDEVRARPNPIPSSVILDSGDANLIGDMKKAHAATFHIVIAALTDAAPGAERGPERPRQAPTIPKVDGSEPELALSANSLRYVAQVGFELAQLDRASRAGEEIGWSRYPNAQRVLNAMSGASSNPGTGGSGEPTSAELLRHLPVVSAVLEGLRVAAEQNAHRPFAEQVATPYGLSAGELGEAISKALSTVSRDGRPTAPQAFARAQIELSQRRGDLSSTNFDEVFLDYLQSLKTTHGFSLEGKQGAEVRDAVERFATTLTRGADAR